MHAKIVCARRLVIVHQIFIQFTMKSKQNNFSGFFKNPYMKIFAANKRWFSGWLSEHFGWKERDRPHIWSYAIIQKLCQYIKYYQLVHHEKRKKERDRDRQWVCVCVCVWIDALCFLPFISKSTRFLMDSQCKQIFACASAYVWFGVRIFTLATVQEGSIWSLLFSCTALSLCITSNTSSVLPFKRSSWLHLFEVSRIKTFSSIWWVDLNVYLSNCILIWMRY